MGVAELLAVAHSVGVVVGVCDAVAQALPLGVAALLPVPERDELLQGEAVLLAQGGGDMVLDSEPLPLADAVVDLDTETEVEPQLLPLALGLRDSHELVEAVAQNVELALCVTLWLVERLPLTEPLLVRVPLLQ